MNPQVLLPWGSLIAAALPRTWAESLAGAAAAVAAPWLGGARHLSRLNLEAALEGTVSKETCARVTFHYALYYLAIMRLAHRTTDAAVGRVRARGMEHVTQTLERGRGCVALGAHVGNWDVSAIAMAQHFGRLHAFAEPLRPASLLRFYCRARARHGVRVLLAGDSGRVPFDVLRANEILGVLVDRPFGSRHAWTRFGRGRLQVPSGAIRLALRSGAGVHTVFALKAREGFDVTVGPDLTANLQSSTSSERVCEVAQRFADALRAVVVRHPEQWCLLYPLSDADGPPRKGSLAGATRPRAGARGAA